MLFFDRLLQLRLFTWLPDDVVRLICEHLMQDAARVIQNAWIFRDLPDLVDPGPLPWWQVQLNPQQMTAYLQVHGLLWAGGLADLEEVD